MFKRFTLILILFLLAAATCAAEEILPEADAEMPVVEDSALTLLDDDPDSVREAQKGLANLGYYKDAVDGKFGKHTEAAIRDFQSQSGLSETGHLDGATYALLSEYSSQNINARTIQQRLIDLGYLQGSADGKFGEKSAKAMRMFQRVNSLPVTGATDAKTIMVLFSDEIVNLPDGLSAGAKGDDVLMLQNSLRRYGFMTEKADGEYGKTTTNAVKAFQEHLIEQGIEVDKNGTATPLTLYCLYSEAYSSYLRDVTPGMTDGEVKRVELRLAELGYMDAEADDTLDDYAYEALCMYQRKAGLETAGMADRRTIDSMFSAAALKADHCAAHEISSGDTGLAVRDVEEALVAGGYTIRLPDGNFDSALEKALEMVTDYLKEEDSPTHLTRETVESLQNGLLEYRAYDASAPADATRIQRRLHTLFYLEEKGIDGIIGGNTTSALHEFQEANGLPRTDGTDQETISALFSTTARAKPYPYRIDVSLERQEVEVWHLNSEGEYDLVQTFTCSTGRNNSTPRGIFLKGHPLNRWHYFKKFYCWAQYSFKIVDDILFHSVIYGSKNENSLHRSSVRNLGNPASHGCVRLSVEDAKWLFEHCERGENVIVIS